jgi:hypothetical protein
MTVGWCQTSGAPVAVRYGTGRNLDQTNDDITTRVFNNTRHVAGQPITSHFVTLTDLQPNTAYWFAIRDSEGIGETMWFRTAPLVLYGIVSP